MFNLSYKLLNKLLSIIFPNNKMLTNNSFEIDVNTYYENIAANPGDSTKTYT